MRHFWNSYTRFFASFCFILLPSFFLSFLSREIISQAAKRETRVGRFADRDTWDECFVFSPKQFVAAATTHFRPVTLYEARRYTRLRLRTKRESRLHNEHESIGIKSLVPYWNWDETARTIFSGDFIKDLITRAASNRFYWECFLFFRAAESIFVCL